MLSLVHERDLDIDFSLVVIKHLLARKPVENEEPLTFKLILMSATFNIELFSYYFSDKAIKETEFVKAYEGEEQKLKTQEDSKKVK
jgi:HrpA-like RNA helicase